MFDTPDLLTPAMNCGSVIFIGLGILFLCGLIPALRIIRRDTTLLLRKKLSLSLAATSAGAMGIGFVCTITAQISVMNQWHVAHDLDGSVCFETPMAAPYKMVLTRLQNGRQYAELAGSERMPTILNIQQYAVVGQYVTGKTDDNYFWFDLDTGAYRYLDNQDAFLESLGRIGVREMPNLLSIETLCTTRNCRPCIR